MRGSLLVVITILLGMGLRAQDGDYRAIRSDQLWLSTRVELKPFKKLGASNNLLTKVNGSLELGYRSEGLFRQTNFFFLDMNLRRKINHWLRGGVEYRFALREADLTNRSRLQLFIRTKRKRFGQFDVTYKGRYQHTFDPTDTKRHVVRNRIAVTYRTPDFRVNPRVSVESFTSFQNTGIHYSGIRYKLGGNVNLPNGQELNIAFVHDREVGVFEPEYRTAISLGYSFDLEND